MSKPALSTQQVGRGYRNLLITLAREARDLKKEVTEMHAALPQEKSKGKQAGMRTLINSRNRQRARLLQILTRNHPATRHFFQTTSAEKIADQEI